MIEVPVEIIRHPSLLSLLKELPTKFPSWGIKNMSPDDDNIVHYHLYSKDKEQKVCWKCCI